MDKNAMGSGDAKGWGEEQYGSHLHSRHVRPLYSEMEESLEQGYAEVLASPSCTGYWNAKALEVWITANLSAEMLETYKSITNNITGRKMASILGRAKSAVARDRLDLARICREHKEEIEHIAETLRRQECK